jgi:hypothetical protein
VSVSFSLEAVDDDALKAEEMFRVFDSGIQSPAEHECVSSSSEAIRVII